MPCYTDEELKLQSGSILGQFIKRIACICMNSLRGYVGLADCNLASLIYSSLSLNLPGYSQFRKEFTGI